MSAADLTDFAIWRKTAKFDRGGNPSLRVADSGIKGMAGSAKCGERPFRANFGRITSGKTCVFCKTVSRRRIGNGKRLYTSPPFSFHAEMRSSFRQIG